MADEEFVYDAANEAVIIGAAVADAEARKRLVHTLGADEFLVGRHAAIWRALRGLTDTGLEYTPEAARKFLEREGGDSGASEYLGGIERDAEVPENLEWHTELMRWDATRARTLKGPVPELLRSLRDPKAVQGDVLGAARAVARALEGSGRRFMRRREELYRQYRAEIAARRVARNVFPLGAPAFDENLTEGFSPGRTTVTAGLPGAGKSTVWMAFAILLARQGRRPLYCAWEMEPESLIDVGVAHMTGIELRRIVQGDLDDEAAHRVDKATRWITSKVAFMENPFFARDTTRKPSNDRNLDVLEGYLAEAGCDVAIYDLWERMLPWRRPDDVSGALYRMQAMHKEYAVHGVIVQQLLLKDVEKRADKRPTRESIKGTGGYVEVADFILGVHRDAQFKAVDDTSVETICLKQRKGKANWSIRWRWDGERCRVDSPEEIPFDPGLEAAVEAGDIGRIVKDVKDLKTGRGRRKIGRRE